MKGHFDLFRELDLEGETVPGQVLIEIAGGNRVLIEGHRGVCGYSRDQISVRVRCGTVQISGCGLELRRMNREQLIIAGKIQGVTLKRRDEA